MSEKRRIIWLGDKGLIDFHTHLRATPLGILTYMDYFNVDVAVVLSGLQGSLKRPGDRIIEACSKYPNRLVPFCTVDIMEPDIAGKIEELVKMGCRGYGEHKTRLRVDDYRSKEVYRVCGELGLPILMHLGVEVPYQASDGSDQGGYNLDIEGFERVLSEFPKTIFLAHGEGWWREISGEVPRYQGNLSWYPQGEIKPGGKMDSILRNHSNIYGDLSAWSGSNAMSRDLEFAKKFVERHRDRLVFGTDYYERKFLAPLLIYTPFKIIDNLQLVEKTYNAITHENAAKILKI